MIYVKTDENKKILHYTDILEEAEAIGYNETVESIDDIEVSYDLQGEYLKGYAPEPPYTWKRQQAYPQLGEQLDMIWHLIDDGTLGEEIKNTEFYLKLKEVKDKYPKENMSKTEEKEIPVEEITEEKEVEDEIPTVEEQD